MQQYLKYIRGYLQYGAIIHRWVIVVGGREGLESCYITPIKIMFMNGSFKRKNEKLK